MLEVQYIERPSYWLYPWITRRLTLWGLLRPRPLQLANLESDSISLAVSRIVGHSSSVGISHLEDERIEELC